MSISSLLEVRVVDGSVEEFLQSLGEVFVVHGGVIAVLEPPRVREVFHAAGHGSADGMWTLDAVRDALDPYRDRAPEVGFFCGDTMALATETIGF